MRIAPWLLISLGLVALALAAPAGAQPLFSKAFDPAEIGPGNVSTLVFTINNPTVHPVENMAFVDNLPQGLFLAAPVQAATTCANAALTAQPGGTSVQFKDGMLGANSSCTVRVDVTATAAGKYANTSGDLTSSRGNSGRAVADLVVNGLFPGFVKTFDPDRVVAGRTSRLALTIFSSTRGGLDGLAFVDPLPDGLVVATPANAATTCAGGASPPVVSAAPGATTVALANGFVVGGRNCEVAVDVLATGAGDKENTTESLTVGLEPNAIPVGKAGAVLEVFIPFLEKRFVDDPVRPGANVVLEFTLRNLNRDPAAGIAFTDNLNAALAGLAAVSLPANPCNSGASLTGTSTLSFTGGQLPAGGSCSFRATLRVPAGAAAGSYLNTTSSVTATVGSTPVVEDAATDELDVLPGLALTKTFQQDPVAAGSSVTLRFRISNLDPGAAATGIGFEDRLGDMIPDLGVMLPASGFCGAGSTIVVDAAQTVTVANASLAAGASCSFDVTLAVPLATPSGDYLNVTGPVSGSLGGVPVTIPGASDSLTILRAPRLGKSFLLQPPGPGGSVALRFVLDNTNGATAAAIGFSDDLSAVLPGLAAVALPGAPPCGAGSSITGTSLLTLAGGELPPNGRCVFDVTLQVPAGAAPGIYTNVTSEVQATVAGLAVRSSPALADLEVAGLRLTKSFTDDPVLAGGQVKLSFTLRNLSPTQTATELAFSDDLDGALPGLAAVGLPAAGICGAGSQLAGAGVLDLTGGTLPPGGACTFVATLEVPLGAPAGDHHNSTSPVTGKLGGAAVTAGGAGDDLVVLPVLTLAKAFVDDPVPPGGEVTLRFTLANADPARGASGIAFTDNLNDVVTNMSAMGLPRANVCGAGSQIAGVTVLAFTGGSLAPGAQCSFDVKVAVPAGAPLDVTVPNVTSAVTGTVAGQAVIGPPASDGLEIGDVSCSPSDRLVVELRDDTVLGPLKVEACDRILIGPNWEVRGPGGFVVLRAGNLIILGNGAMVGPDGVLDAADDPRLRP